MFSSGDGPPLILVHGTTADHTTWRATGPELAHGYRVHAIDRRGRGASGDGSDDAGYSIELEYDDLAAVADAVAGEAEMPVDVVGHSYGGRIGLGAALRTASIARLVVYEGAPSPAGGEGYRPSGVEDRIATLIEAGDLDAAAQTFFREIVRMPEPELDAYRANPVWPVRVAAVRTSLARDPGGRARRRRRSTRSAASRSRCSRSWAATARRRSTRRPRRSTHAWRTAASSSSRARATPPITPTSRSSSRAVRAFLDDPDLT